LGSKDLALFLFLLPRKLGHWQPLPHDNNTLCREIVKKNRLIFKYFLIKLNSGTNTASYKPEEKPFYRRIR
jgi:hypothetical protein